MNGSSDFIFRYNGLAECVKEKKHFGKTFNAHETWKNFNL
jgi:hypothetical protein